MSEVRYAQIDLFAEAPAAPARPPGFLYRSELIGVAEERELIVRVAALEVTPFAFRGYLGRRRTASFGWRYDFSERVLNKTRPIPDFLLPVREQAAAFAGLPAEALEQALVTEYAPGAPIGWHRDRPEFGQVVGISLVSPCLFRLRRREGPGWARASLTLAPRSAYLISGEARSVWEHSIPEVEALRYSITFRTLKAA